MLTFISGLLVALLGLVPTVLSIGSSARRQLGLINTEAETLKVLPDGPARLLLAGQLDHSMEQYCASRTQKSDRKAIPWTLRLPVGAPLAITVVSAVFAIIAYLRWRENRRADRDLFDATVYVFGTAAVITYILAFAIVFLRSSQRRRVSATDWNAIASSVADHAMRQRLAALMASATAESKSSGVDIGTILSTIELSGSDVTPGSETKRERDGTTQPATGAD